MEPVDAFPQLSCRHYKATKEAAGKSAGAAAILFMEAVS